MKKLHFAYSMKIEYSFEVTRCNYTIKCFPQTNRRQRIDNVMLSLNPSTPYCNGIDGLGNRQIYGTNELPHYMFEFKTEGNALTGLSDYEDVADMDKSMIFRHPHGLNLAGEQIKEYFEQIKPETSLENFEKADYLMRKLYSDFSYVSGSTDVKTTAEEAFAQRKGVCQDYAHILISLLHQCKIPARYVTGLLIGEGASHAWVEVLDNGKWYGFDPTNNCVVKEDHIKIAVGRDARDCLINRGTMHGGGDQLQEISVIVTEL